MGPPLGGPPPFPRQQARTGCADKQGDSTARRAMPIRRTLLALLLAFLPMSPAVARRPTGAQAAPASPPRLDIAEQRQHHCCRAIAIDNSGRLLATTMHDEVTLWDLDSGLELRTLVPRTRAIRRKPAEAVASDGFSGLAFDPSGRYLALTAVDNVNPRTFVRARLLAFPHVWEVESGRDLSAVDWSYDADTQRTVSPAFPFEPRETLFWQVTNEPAVATKLARYQGTASTFSPDGRLGIAFASEGGPEDYAYRLSGVDVDSNRQLWTRRIAGSSPPLATISPDNRLVAVTSWTGTWVLDSRTGIEVATPVGASAVASGAFSGDSRRLVLVRENTARVFDTSSWRTVAEMRASPNQWLRHAVFTPDGGQVVAVTGEDIYVWESTSGRELRRITMDGARPFQTVAISPRGRWLAAGTVRPSPGLSSRGEESPATVFVWPLSNGAAPRAVWAEGDTSILALAFSPDDERIGSVAFAEFSNRSGPQFDSDISFKTFSTDEEQTLQSEASGRRRGNEEVVEETGAKDLIFLRDGSRLIAGVLELRAPADGLDYQEFVPHAQLMVYDGRTLQRRQVIETGSHDLTAMAVSLDGRTIATAHEENTVRLWSVAPVRPRGLFRWPAVDRRDVLGGALYSGPVTGLAFHPDGRWLAVSRNDGIALVDVTRRTRRGLATAKDHGYSAVAFSPDGSSLLFAGGRVQGQGFVDAYVSQWVTATGRPGWTIQLGTTELPRLAFGPGGRWFAAATSGGVSIHDAATGTQLASMALLATDDWIVWTPDGRYAGTPAGVSRLAAVRQGRRAVPLRTVGRQLPLSELLQQVLR